MIKRILCIAAALMVGVAFLCPLVVMADAPAPEYSEDDIVLLARLISAEARGEEYAGQLAVGNVVVNRLQFGIWGDTLESVIYHEEQFAEPLDWYTDSCYDAAREALLGDERAVPAYVLYFRREKADDYRGIPWYCEIGRHNFYGAPSEDSG